MTLQELKNKFKDIDWSWGNYEVYSTANQKTYLLHEFDTSVWVYDIMPESLSVIETHSNKTLKQVKEILG